jgi:hypothetical protein
LIWFIILFLSVENSSLTDCVEVSEKKMKRRSLAKLSPIIRGSGTKEGGRERTGSKITIRGSDKRDKERERKEARDRRKKKKKVREWAGVCFFPLSYFWFSLVSFRLVTFDFIEFSYV